MIEVADKPVPKGMLVTGSRIGAVCWVLVLAACVWESPSGLPDGEGDPPPGDSIPTAGLSFTDDVQPIFNQNCASSGCHGSAQSAGLDLRSGSAFAGLVNVAATQEQAVRVIPGDAAASYLVIKLEDRQSAGKSMPIGASLSAARIQAIRKWIDEGAGNN